MTRKFSRLEARAVLTGEAKAYRMGESVQRTEGRDRDAAIYRAKAEAVERAIRVLDGEERPL